jgi:hypothetical protein
MRQGRGADDVQKKAGLEGDPFGVAPETGGISGGVGKGPAILRAKQGRQRDEERQESIGPEIRTSS